MHDTTIPPPLAQSTLLSPSKGSALRSVPVSPGDSFTLAFSPQDATLERHQDDLAISFNDGTAIVLKSFFNVLLRCDNLTLITHNGSILSGDALKTAFTPYLTGRGF